MSTKRKYEKPLIDLVDLDEKDIIITSPVVEKEWNPNSDIDVDKF